MLNDSSQVSKSTVTSNGGEVHEAEAQPNPFLKHLGMEADDSSVGAFRPHPCRRPSPRGALVQAPKVGRLTQNLRQLQGIGDQVSRPIVPADADAMLQRWDSMASAHTWYLKSTPNGGRHLAPVRVVPTAQM